MARAGQVHAQRHHRLHDSNAGAGRRDVTAGIARTCAFDTGACMGLVWSRGEVCSRLPAAVYSLRHVVRRGARRGPRDARDSSCGTCAGFCGAADAGGRVPWLSITTSGRRPGPRAGEGRPAEAMVQLHNGRARLAPQILLPRHAASASSAERIPRVSCSQCQHMSY